MRFRDLCLWFFYLVTFGYCAWMAALNSSIAVRHIKNNWPEFFLMRAVLALAFMVIAGACIKQMLKITVIAMVLLAIIGSSANAAVRTPNFIVSAAPAYEQPLASAAEQFRKELALDWLGYELPTWNAPCSISATVSRDIGNGGSTRFAFGGGEVFDFRMEIQGTPQEIVQSVLQHEVLHAVFASHFLQPLPRWADEGACSTVESRAEQSKHHSGLVQFLKTGRGIPFDRMFAMQEYPRDVMPLYAQGRSVAAFLVQHDTKQRFVTFLATGLQDQDWRGAVEVHYGYQSLGELQAAWLDWFRAGSQPPAKEIRVGYG